MFTKTPVSKSKEILSITLQLKDPVYYSNINYKILRYFTKGFTVMVKCKGGCVYSQGQRDLEVTANNTDNTF